MTNNLLNILLGRRTTITCVISISMSLFSCSHRERDEILGLKNSVNSLRSKLDSVLTDKVILESEIIQVDRRIDGCLSQLDKQMKGSFVGRQLGYWMAGGGFVYPSLWKLHISADGDDAYLTVAYQGINLIEYYGGMYNYSGREGILTCTFLEHTSTEGYNWTPPMEPLVTPLFLNLKKAGLFWKTMKEDEPIVSLRKE